MASYGCRYDYWKLQEKLALTGIKQIKKQILAAEIRKSMAEKDLENRELQIEKAEEVYAVVKNKFINQELYNRWYLKYLPGGLLEP
jgi:hypothetical protein